MLVLTSFHFSFLSSRNNTDLSTMPYWHTWILLKLPCIRTFCKTSLFKLWRDLQQNTQFTSVSRTVWLYIAPSQKCHHGRFFHFYMQITLKYVWVFKKHSNFSVNSTSLTTKLMTVYKLLKFCLFNSLQLWHYRRTRHLGRAACLGIRSRRLKWPPYRLYK